MIFTYILYYIAPSLWLNNQSSPPPSSCLTSNTLIGVVGVTIFMDPFYGGKLLPQAHLLLKLMLCPLVDTL